jgi:fatty-acyl-CoA synthase
VFPGTHALTTPDKPAVVMTGSGRTTTYRQLADGSARLARYLHGHGLRRGDTLALLCENVPEAFEIYWAAHRAGLYLTPINYHLTPDEIAYILTDSAATALITSAARGASAVAAVAGCDAVRLRLAFGGPVPGFACYADELRDVPATPPDDQPAGADLLYSSGTTGRPKGIKPELPDRQVDQPGNLNALVFGGLYRLRPRTVFLSPAPLYHSAPLKFCAAVHACGGTVVMMEHFDAPAALAAIERHAVTHAQFVPTMFVRMLKLPAEQRTRHDLSTLRAAVHGAAPCPPEVKRAMIDWWGPVLHEYYAATEGHGMTFISSVDWLRKPGSVGRSLRPDAIRICADDGTELPPGRAGIVYFARDRPFSYHNDGTATSAARHPDHPNWTTVGDLGYLDDEGFLFLTDRKTSMIISGGVNIHPREIEDCLALHPQVLDVGVAGTPDPDLGEVVTAFVLPADGACPGPELAAELIGYAGARLARFKVPRRVEFVTELPRTPTGKLLRRLLTTTAVADLGVTPGRNTGQ